MPLHQLFRGGLIRLLPLSILLNITITTTIKTKTICSNNNWFIKSSCYKMHNDLYFECLWNHYRLSTINMLRLVSDKKILLHLLDFMKPMFLSWLNNVTHGFTSACVEMSKLSFLKTHQTSLVGERTYKFIKASHKRR